MHPKINPMPETLDEANRPPRPGDMVAPVSVADINRGFGEAPPQKLTEAQQTGVDRKISEKLTESFLSKEILEEKIQSDINSAKNNPDLKATTSPKDILKDLIAKGNYREDVEIQNHKWTMHALTQGEIVLAFSDIKDDSTSAIARVAVLTLSQIAFAVDACDGTSIYEWFSDIIRREEFVSAEEFKFAVRRTFRRYLEQMPHSTIAEFEEAYATIEKKRNEAIDKLKKV